MRKVSIDPFAGLFGAAKDRLLDAGFDDVDFADVGLAVVGASLSDDGLTQAIRANRGSIGRIFKERPFTNL